MDVWQGPTHCGWGNLVFLVISWPLGTEVPGAFMSDRRTRMFVPCPVRDTGYHRNGWHLWVMHGAIDRAVWLVHGNTVERWPAAREIIACA